MSSNKLLTSLYRRTLRFAKKFDKYPAYKSLIGLIQTEDKVDNYVRLFLKGKDLYWPSQSIYDFIINEVKMDKMPLIKSETEGKDSKSEFPINPSNDEYIDLLMETNRYFSEIVSESKMNGFDQYNSISNIEDPFPDVNFKVFDELNLSKYTVLLVHPSLYPKQTVLLLLDFKPVSSYLLVPISLGCLYNSKQLNIPPVYYTRSGLPVMCALSDKMDEKYSLKSKGIDRDPLYFWNSGQNLPHDDEFSENTLFFNGYETIKPEQLKRELEVGNLLGVTADKPFFFYPSFKSLKPGNSLYKVILSKLGGEYKEYIRCDFI